MRGVSRYFRLLGTFARSNWALALAALGVVLASWYALRLYQGTMNGPPPDVAPRAAGGRLMVLAPIVALTVLIGVFPAPLLSAIGRAVSPVLSALAGAT